MVKAREDTPRRQDGSIDTRSWTQTLTEKHGHLDADRVLGACEFVRSLPRRGEIYLENGMELAGLVADLKMDTSSVVAALAYRPVRAEEASIAEMEAVFGADVAHLLEDVARMATASILEMTNARLHTSERRDQVENVRHMLIALIDDARVAVLKLAERVVALRTAKNSSEDRKQRIAREAHLIFAPLANRLGVWQLKWELEDLSLRYLAPDIYMAIAKQLDGRRGERERRVAEIVESLEGQLRSQGVDATVTGRAKHIYSIWRKMQTKKVGIDQVHDVRAVRILVDSIAQCYAALGVIHTQWRHIPSEFDDYIAAPKENGYRSIHTAVLGPDGLTLEVQIRTREMHQEAELGVCAHWAYKEKDSEDRPFAEKLNWLRQVVELGNESLSAAYGHEDFGAELQQLFDEERIFVYTPAGHVVDLTSGATPLDFAYRVHTEIGHRCRGALVNGRPATLNSRLETGQQVEILTAEEGGPNRSWIEPHLGFVHTSRARQKIHDWFRSRDVAVNVEEGQNLLGEILGDLGVAAPPPHVWENAARELDLPGVMEIFSAVGAGDLPVVDVIDLLFAEKVESPQLSLIPEPEATAPAICRVEVESPDRDGLLLDIATLLSEEEIPLLANWGRVDRDSGCAIITLEIPFPGFRALAAIVEQLKCVEGVTQARRVT